MICPQCFTPDCFVNFFSGIDCLNPKCLHFQNGHKGDILAVDLPSAAALPKGEDLIGETVLVHRGMGWNAAPDGVWMRATVIKYHADGIPQDFYTVALNSEERTVDGHVLPVGHHWLCYPQDIMAVQ
jgi:hypothetical protein